MSIGLFTDKGDQPSVTQVREAVGSKIAGGLRPGGILVSVLQLPAENLAKVSKSRY
jgi:hypothetical protein